MPGDPILQMLGEGAPVTDVQAARHAYGLDLPLGRQYLNYWEGVLRGDLGPSLRFNQNVTRLIAQRYPYTLELTLAALAVAAALLCARPAAAEPEGFNRANLRFNQSSLRIQRVIRIKK